MTRPFRLAALALLAGAALALAAPAPARADFIVNGGFELGLTGWVRSDALGSDGTFSVQTGTSSPVSGTPVVAPPVGFNAAMSDGNGPGSHVLYQDFFIPTTTVTSAVLSFRLYLNNLGGFFATPTNGSLDFGINGFNQQVRVDLMSATSDPFSVASADVLQSIYQSKAGDPLVSGYTLINTDVTSVIAANRGKTIRLRFAEVDNNGPLLMGVDGVSLNAVPEPSSVALCGVGAAVLFAYSRRRARARD